MKAIIIKEGCKGPNPKFNRRKPVDRKTNWPEVDVPVGTVIDHPDCHYLTYGDDPNAEPHDDECKAAHDDYLKLREEGLAQRAAAEQGTGKSGETDEPPANESTAPKLKPRPTPGPDVVAQDPAASQAANT